MKGCPLCGEGLECAHCNPATAPAKAPCPAWEDGEHCYVVIQVFAADAPSGVIGRPTMRQESSRKVCACGATVERRKT